MFSPYYICQFGVLGLRSVSIQWDDAGLKIQSRQDESIKAVGSITKQFHQKEKDTMIAADDHLQYSPGHSSHETYDQSVVQKLPTELKERLASFLSTRDLLNLTECSKTLSSDLNVSIISSPLTDRASRDKSYRSHRGLAQCFAVVIPRGDRFHSMAFTCNVRNEGFETRAEVTIVEQDLPPPRLEMLRDFRRRPESLRDFINGKEVARVTTVRKSKLSLSFPGKPNKFYQFFITTLGPEELGFVHLSDMSLVLVGFSNKSTEYTAYQFDVWQQPNLRNFEHMGLLK